MISVDAAGYTFRSEAVPVDFRVTQLPGVNQLKENVPRLSLNESSVKNVFGNPAVATLDAASRARRSG